MDIELGDSGITVGDAADLTKKAGALTKGLPGMVKKDDAGSAEPETCPTCNQKIVTSEPMSSSGIDVDKGLETAGNAMDCCSKAFDCFGKGMDAADTVQGMTG